MSGSSPRENQPSSTSGASSDLSVDLDRAARSCPGRHWALRRGRRSSCSPHFGGRHIECAALAVGSRSVCRPVDARMCSRALLPAWAWGGRDGAPQGSVFAMLAAVGFLRCGLCAVRQPAPWPLRLCLTALRLPCGLRPTPACMLALRGAVGFLLLNGTVRDIWFGCVGNTVGTRTVARLVRFTDIRWPEIKQKLNIAI